MTLYIFALVMLYLGTAGALVVATDSDAPWNRPEGL